MTVNQLGLHFNDTDMHRDLIMELMYAVFEAANDIKFAMMSSASESISDDSAWFIESVNEAEKRIITSGYSMISFQVGAQHWNAFLDNYGTGSLMDKNNPWLQQYISSGYFNKERLEHSMAVVGRPAGEYSIPDFKEGHGGTTRVSKGRLKGQNLETKINDRTGKPYFIPESPRHWLEKSIEMGQHNLKIRVNRVLETFNFASYLKGGIR